ncbi:alpha/beta hydrolase [Sphingobacterium lactis]|uniref:Acetyl esterase/lipase n=1 Tax=Sphingobacterium lactis TaxID=797291 RepID=A0A1H5VDR4_9SPHI|nr:alpha/beta hydrolase [Sphingobacterium lactis]SEF84617.1 Acetyl esterase/lipase [Sphingobacterium lactis]
MKNLLLLLLSIMSIHLYAQDTGEMRALYGVEEIPGSLKPVQELEDADIPKLFVHTAADSSKDIVFLVIPGGGYSHVAINHEGHAVAKRLNDLGYSAYVLRYRLPKATTMKDKRYGPVQDAQYAMAQIRKDHPNKKIAVIGFSAGGHLAASVSNLFELPQTEALKQVNLRPDFTVLAYPVISFEDAITNKGTKESLIGPDFKPEDVEFFSMENRVSESSQPTFLMSAKDDKTVPIENANRYAKALNAYNVRNAMFTYEEGGHGFGLINKTNDRDWFAAMMKWLEEVNAQ